MKHSILGNFAYAFGAQVVSLLASLAITFIVPSLIGSSQFAYWQLFLTYVTYVNISRIGVSDGLYLRLGGKKYEELDYDLLSKELRIFVTFQFAVAILIANAVLFLDLNEDRKFVLLSCCVCIVIVNAKVYLVYLLQAVNMTRVYSISVVLQNLTWFVAVAIIFCFHIYSYKVIIILYIIGHICAGIYLCFHAKEVIQFRNVRLKTALLDIKENIYCGIKLMIATYAGSLVISSAKMIVDAAWGVEVFGFFSFSLTLANVFLTFIKQLSVVVFPALRRVKDDQLKTIHYIMRNVLSLLLPVVMLGYFPIIVFVHLCLPQYVQSISYLPFFLPICTFDGKMQMMCSSFFKSMRKENTLLAINICTLLFSIVVALIGAFWVKTLVFVASGILVTIALRSVVSELILAHLLETDIRNELVQEICLVVIFVVGACLLPAGVMFFLFGILYVLYLFINRERVKNVFAMRKFS